MLKGVELEEEAARKVRNDLERKVRHRLEAVITLHKQRAERAQRQLQEQVDDREFRRRQMEVLAERDKLEQMSNDRRRQRIVEHNRIVQQLLESKRNRNAEELMRKLDEKLEQEREEEELFVNNIYDMYFVFKYFYFFIRKRIVEEERIKILQEYAVNLGGVFPRGILRDSDREKLNL